MLSNKITVTSTAAPIGSEVINGPLLVYALEGNTNAVVLGDANVVAASGYNLEGGQSIEFGNVAHLEHIYAVVATGTEELSWIKLNP